MVRRAGVLAALLLAASSAYAVDWTVLKKEGALSDFAGVVDPQSRSVVDQYAAKVEKATGAQIALVIIPSLQGEPLDDVADTLYRGWGIQGALLLLVTQDRRCHLDVGAQFEEMLPDHFDSLLIDNMRPEITASRFGPAMITAAQAIGEAIGRSKNVTLAPPAQPRVIQRHHLVPWVSILFGLFVFWFLLRLNVSGGGRNWTGFLLGNLLNRGSYSGRGGGGFGGYDSGGSRGGFGGADSGPRDRRKSLSDW
jgi:uncharacterized protein